VKTTYLRKKKGPRKNFRKKIKKKLHESIRARGGMGYSGGGKTKYSRQYLLKSSTKLGAGYTLQQKDKYGLM